MNLKMWRHNSLQILGRILVAEQDDDFFRGTIDELLMKIKLVYPGLRELQDESEVLEEILHNYNGAVDDLRQAKFEAQGGETLSRYSWAVEYTEGLRREQEAIVRQSERVIEDEIRLRSENRRQ